MVIEQVPTCSHEGQTHLSISVRGFGHDTNEAVCYLQLTGIEMTVVDSNGWVLLACEKGNIPDLFAIDRKG